MLKHSGIDLDLDAAPQVSSAGFDAIDALYARETQANIVATLSRFAKSGGGSGNRSP
jgi:hypothetical protein